MRPLHNTSVSKGLSVLTRIVFLGNRALVHHNTRLGLIHMQHLLLRLLSSVRLLPCASQGFAIHRQMDMPLTCLGH